MKVAGAGGAEVGQAPVERRWFELPVRAKAEGSAPILPFRLLADDEAHPYTNCVPLYSLKAAAGGFSEGQVPEAEGWAGISTRRKLSEGMFVAQVVGHSMEPKIPDGAYCLFVSPVEGDRNGRTVLVQHRDIHDPETGGSYTVKVYESRKDQMPDGTWRHKEIALRPLNPAFRTITLAKVPEGEVQVVAEVVEVLG
jgi:phage repressor protein C with HTH and peptisase S24 domain